MHHRAFLTDYRRQPAQAVARHRAWLTTVPGVPEVLAQAGTSTPPAVVAGRIASLVLRDFATVTPLATRIAAAGKGNGNGTATRKVAPYTATVRNPDGSVATARNDAGETVELRKGGDKGSAIGRWLDLRLVESAPDAYGELCFPVGEPLRVTRESAMARVLGARGPSAAAKGAPSKGFDGKMKANPSRVTFSRG